MNDPQFRFIVTRVAGTDNENMGFAIIEIESSILADIKIAKALQLHALCPNLEHLTFSNRTDRPYRIAVITDHSLHKPEYDMFETLFEDNDECEVIHIKESSMDKLMEISEAEHVSIEVSKLQFLIRGWVANDIIFESKAITNNLIDIPVTA